MQKGLREGCKWPLYIAKAMPENNDHEAHSNIDAQLRQKCGLHFLSKPVRSNLPATDSSKSLHPDVLEVRLSM